MSEYDTTPLFGEESKGSKVLTWLIIVVIAIWVLYCIAIGVAFGILMNIANILLAATLVVGAAGLILLWKWWRQEDLDPKFRVLIAILVVQVLLSGVALNVYIWPARNAAPFITPADYCIYYDKTLGSPRIWFEGTGSGGMCKVRCPPGWGFDFNLPNPGCQIFNGTLAAAPAPKVEERLLRVEKLKRQEDVVDPDGRRRVWNPFKKQYVLVVEK